MRKYIFILVSILLTFTAAGIGSYFTVPNIQSWYQMLQKPFFSPPNWLFGPVWTVLYLMMGVAFSLILNKNQDKNRSKAIKLFLIQLIFNVLWSFAFFGLHSPLLGFLVIVVLWAMILFTMRVFLRINKTAGWLFVPYLLWVSFAMILNLAVVILNP